MVIVQEVRTNELGNVVEPSKLLTEYSLEELKESTRIVKQMQESNPVVKRQSSNGLRPVYIAANISSLDNSFSVGDGRSYGEYKNYELQSNKTYRVAIAILIDNQQVRIT